jgi:hypothetical protein
MLKAINNVLLASLSNFTLFAIFRVLSALTLFLEHIMGDALLWRENCIDKELVIVCRVQESDHLGRLLINVIVIDGVLRDFLRWVDKLANVDSSRLGMLAKEVRQLLKVVGEVLRLFQVSEKVSLLLLLDLLSRFFSSLLLLLSLVSLGLLFATQFNCFFLLLPLMIQN